METRVARWERVVALPLTFASILFVGAYAWPILDPGLAQAGSSCAPPWCG